MGIRVVNNASSKLATSLDADAGFMTVLNGDGALFPTFEEGDYAYATILDVNGQLEIVKITGRVADTMTIERAQEGTLACHFDLGAFVEMRFTAGMFRYCLEGTNALSKLSVTADTVEAEIPASADFSLEDALLHLNIPRGPRGVSITATAIDNSGNLWVAADADISVPDIDAAEVPDYFQKFTAPMLSDEGFVINYNWLVGNGWDTESPVAVEIPENALLYNRTGTNAVAINSPVGVLLINRGTIVGRGGAGGIGYTNGGDGTDAIHIYPPSERVILVNYGIIAGGGGGGGAGGSSKSPVAIYEGGGGGGGAGYPVGAAGGMVYNVDYYEAGEGEDGRFELQTGGVGGNGGRLGYLRTDVVNRGDVGHGGQVFGAAGTDGELGVFDGTETDTVNGSGGGGGALGANGGNGATYFAGRGGLSGAAIRGAVKVTVMTGMTGLYGSLIEDPKFVEFYKPTLEEDE